MKHVGRTDKSEINNAGGIQDTALHSELERHRIHPANFRMLQLLPPLMVAWADGEVGERERKQILRMASLRGISEGYAEHTQLEQWLEDPPPEALHHAALAHIHATLRGRPRQEADSLARELYARCTEVASASRSFYGLGPRISQHEREALESVAREIRPFTYSLEEN